MKPLPAHIKELIGQLLPDEGTAGTTEVLDVFRAVSVAQALTENGIRAQAMTANVVFDPEQWTNPLSIVGVKVRGVLLGGDGIEGWEAIAQVARQRLKVAGQTMEDGYCDRMRAYRLNLSDLQTLNQNSPTQVDRLNSELARARAITQAALMEKKTPDAAVRAPKGPRL